MAEKMKKCNVCGKVKPLSDYYKSRTGKDGHYSICKKCVIKKNAKYAKQQKPTEYMKCAICGQLLPATHFFKYKTKYRKICKGCLTTQYTVPDKIKEIAALNQFPPGLLMKWTDTAIECYEIGCNCSRCFIGKYMESDNCRMKDAVRLLIQIHGKPLGVNEPTII